MEYPLDQGLPGVPVGILRDSQEGSHRLTSGGVPPEAADAGRCGTAASHTPRIPSDPEHFQQWFFLPWHRLMLHQFEGVIREVLQDESFSLPYWNPVTGNHDDFIVPAVFRDPGSPLFNGTRWFWVNGGEPIDKLYQKLDQSERPQREVLHRLGATATSGSIPGWTRTRTSSLISHSAATWRSSPRWGVTRSSISTTPTWTGSGKAGTGSATRIQPIPSTSTASSAYGDRSGKHVDLPVSATNRTAQMGYEYDSYEKPPKPETLTASEAAAREAALDSLMAVVHGPAQGSSHGSHEHPGLERAGPRRDRTSQYAEAGGTQ